MQQKTKEYDRQKVRLHFFFIRRCLEVKARGSREKDSACPFPVSAPPCGAFPNAPTSVFQANGLIYRPLFQSVCEALLCSGRHGASGGCNDSADLWGQKSGGRNRKRACGLLLNAEVFPRLSWSAHTLRLPGVCEASADHLRL